MLIALDVHYREKEAKAVAVVFNWQDEKPRQIITEYIPVPEEYIPGEFYKRELPCLMQILGKMSLQDIEAIIIDGYVFTDNNDKYGLGGMLWEALDRSVPVIGVAKTPFRGNMETVKTVFRGESKNPLYVSAIGYDLQDAAQKIQYMSGSHRIPTVLKELDTITKKP